MRIAYLLAYPIYHERGSLASSEGRGPLAPQWLTVENQNQWIPAVLTEMGHKVTYWIGDVEGGEYVSEMPGFPAYPVLAFKGDPVDRRTKYHQSQALVEHARRARPDLVLIKGIDGGLGTHLIESVLKPESIPFALVTGGAYYTRHVHDALAVVYETEYQRERLAHPGPLRRWWRPPVAPDKLIPMPKSVDTDRFRPMPEVEKQYDVVVVGRLDRRQKSFEEAGRLSERLRVAIAGDGPEAERLRRRYPRIDWKGHIQNDEIPAFLNSGHLFLHPAARDRRPTRDFFPRVVAEAMACGVPPIGFARLIHEDVIPEGCGLRVDRRDFEAPIEALLKDTQRRETMAKAARAHAVDHLGKRSSAPAMRAVLARLEATR